MSGGWLAVAGVAALLVGLVLIRWREAFAKATAAFQEGTFGRWGQARDVRKNSEVALVVGAGFIGFGVLFVILSVVE